jgi:hypothetical protein
MIKTALKGKTILGKTIEVFDNCFAWGAWL